MTKGTKLLLIYFTILNKSTPSIPVTLKKKSKTNNKKRSLNDKYTPVDAIKNLK